MAISNDEIIACFVEIENLKKSNNLEDTKQIKNIQNKIIKNLSFLVYRMAKQYKRFENYEDLVQDGFIGLIKATKKFNYTMFPNFYIYAEQWIKHNIKRSASRFDVVYNPKRKRVVYAEINESESEECAESPEEIFLNKEAQYWVKEVLKEFSERDQEIMERMFGLNDRPKQTLREIGPDFNLTHERIRQIKNHVLLKLKKNQILNNLY